MITTIHVVLDFEMNPVSAKLRTMMRRRDKRLAAELIEIGAVKLNDAYEVMDEFSMMIRPELNVRIEPNITALTGIEYEEVEGAETFEPSLKKFAEWIGDEEATIYSWSCSDLNQIRNECEFKGLTVPTCMDNWEDFQEMFPRITEINLRRQISLESAAEMAGVTYTDDAAHRALYDARVTAELVQIVLSGEYKTRMASVRNVIKPDVEVSTFSLGDKFAGQLAKLFEKGDD